MDAPDLKLVPLNKMIEEIQSRYDAFVFMAYRQNHPNGNYSSVKNFKGNHFICMGLCEHVKNDLDKAIKEGMIPDNL